MSSYAHHGHTGAWPGYTNPAYHRVQQPDDIELISTHSQPISSKYNNVGFGESQDFQNKSSFVSQERLVDAHQYLRHQPHIYQGYPSDIGTVLGAVWRPGFWIRFPYVGITALLGVLACTAASVGILINSDGRDVATWGRLAPSVYLAILSVVSNILTGAALTEGLRISFWRTLLQGCTLAELQRNWHCGHSFVQSVFFGLRRGGRIPAIACFFSAIALLRAPLFQKASVIQSNVGFPSQGSVNINLAQYLPIGYAGLGTYSRAVNYDTSRLTPAFIDVMNGYTANTPMLLEGANCGEQCFMTVNGFGWKPNCHVDNITVREITQAGTQFTRFNTTVDLYKISQNDTRGFYGGIRLNATFYEGHAARDGGNSTALEMKTYMTSHVCDLTGATVAYKLNVTQRGLVTLSNRTSDVYLKDLELLQPGKSGEGSVVGGFQYVGDYLFSSSAVYNFAGAVSSITLKGALANQMAASKAGTTWSNDFNDPMETMLLALREIAFRASLKAGRENTTESEAAQIVSYDGFDTKTVYITNTKITALAASLALLSVFAVGTTFWGWWLLGRRMTLSPLEIAKAFDAPLLKDVHGNVRPREFAEHVKRQHVRYGASTVRKRFNNNTTDGYAYTGGGVGEAERLVIASSAEVRPPRYGARYDN